MQILPLLTFLATICAVRLEVTEEYYGYSLVEQLDWPNRFSECGGARQSPIKLIRNRTIPSNGSPLVFNGYSDELPPLILTNNGNTVILTVDPDFIKPGVRIPSISGSILQNEYEFDNIHLHWGRGNAFGSEHTIGKLTTPLELHIVHKRIGNSIERSSQQFNEFAVLGVLYSLERTSGNGLDPIFKQICKVRNFNTTVSVQGSFTLASFLGDIDTSKFYQYDGSLTTPPCTASVSWFVFSDLLSVTGNQLKQLRRLKTIDRNGQIVQMLENARITQPLNNRTVDFYVRKQRAWNFIENVFN